MNQSRRYLVGFVLFLVMGIFACYQFVPLFLPECYEPGSELRDSNVDNNFESRWLVSNVFISASKSAIYMIANENHVVLYGTSNARCRSPILINLNAENGNSLHEGVDLMPSNRGIYHTAYNSDYLYLGYHGTGKAINSSLVGAGGVVAYRVDNGKIVWTKPISGTREVRSLVAGNDFVSIDGGGFSHWYYLINSKTGEIVSKQDKLELGLPSPPANVAFWYYHEAINTPQFIQESDIETISFWAARFEKTFQPPVILNNMLFVRQGEGTSLGSVVAISGQNGDIVWETDDNVVSNVAVNDTTAFFLTSAAELIAIDVKTGQNVGSIQFTNGNIQLGEDRGFFVAANEGNVFVYFGDSRQLFAFRFLPER